MYGGWGRVLSGGSRRQSALPTGGSEWQSALPTGGSEWQSALPTGGSRWVLANFGGGLGEREAERSLPQRDCAGSAGRKSAGKPADSKTPAA